MSSGAGALPPRSSGWGARKPPPEGDGTEPPKRKRYWWRFTLAAVLIVAVSAGATASSVLLFLEGVVNDLQASSGHLHEEVEEELEQVDGGAPQTILILGSDKRAGPEFEEGEFGRSDTAMLLRLDPGKGLISVLSIPRDLKVEIPEFGTDKFNAAYSDGGPKLTLKVVKELTGLHVSHIVNVDFLGFVRAVDAIGCVYVDVDRRYYHSNVGLPASEQYSEINIQPGYQKLCGKKALQYVRYRHTDTDIVRSARQQSFISQARRQVGLGTLLTDQEHLEQIFTDYTASDINSVKELLQLIDLVVESRGSELNQVHFPAELGPSYVYASKPAIEEAVGEFLGQTGADAKKRDFPEDEEKKKKGKKSKQGGKGAKASKKQTKKKGESKTKEKRKAEYQTTGSDELIPASETGYAEGKIVARRVGGGFPVYYPTRLPAGAAFVESNPYEHVVDPRVYHLKDKGRERHPAYRMVGVYQPEYEVTYFGIQGIRGWEDPPVLDSPSETRKINGREYDIYVDGGKVTMVAWHRGENSYWISNSLQDSLTNDQMIGIARSAKLILPKKKNMKNGGKKG